jgi:hypothetical protein
MWTKTPDGSIVDPTGKVIYFSTARFVNDICLGNCCFICGAKPGEKKFNDEHVVPEWLLRRFRLFDRTIILPNGNPVRYGSYTVPCCEDCNSLLGKVVETTISEIVRGGAQAINDFAAQGSLLKLFVWLGLIFLKTHLKDRSYRTHLDARKGEEKIADQYEWDRLHHIHCIVRCFYNGCTVAPEAIGSFLSLPVRTSDSNERFDFADLYESQTMLVRLDDLSMLSVFDDSGGAMSYFGQKLEKITGPVSTPQLREVMAHLAFLNMHLKNRPTFRTEFDMINERCWIIATRPEFELMELDRKTWGDLLHHAVQHELPRIQVGDLSREEVLAAIKTGKASFLFDKNGEFITDPGLQ